MLRWIGVDAEEAPSRATVAEEGVSEREVILLRARVWVHGALPAIHCLLAEKELPQALLSHVFNQSSHNGLDIAPAPIVDAVVRVAALTACRANGQGGAWRSPA